MCFLSSQTPFLGSSSARNKPKSLAERRQRHQYNTVTHAEQTNWTGDTIKEVINSLVALGSELVQLPVHCQHCPCANNERAQCTGSAHIGDSAVTSRHWRALARPVLVKGKCCLSVAAIVITFRGGLSRDGRQVRRRLLTMRHCPCRAQPNPSQPKRVEWSGVCAGAI